MSHWPSVKAKQALKALPKIGWVVVSQTGSHKKLKHQASVYPMYVWSYGDGDELGSKILSRIAKHTGLKPEDL
ncbi:MAG: type II toxin-antitoxin system HicA family toxin [Candidatus Sulfotelmatobacter sp.]